MPSPDEVKRSIVKMIQDSQRKGLADRDAKAYLRIWTDDARIISGRHAKPDRHDYAIVRKHFERAVKMRSRGKVDAQLQLSYRDERVVLRRDSVTVTWIVQVSWRAGGEQGQEHTAERYELVQTAAGWRVKENRFWPDSRTHAGVTTTYDQATWAKLDAAVDKARAAGEDVGLAHALYEAWRLREGLELMRKLTGKIPGRGAYWQWLARFADRVRNVDESLAAYRQLKTIDTRASLPGWVEVSFNWDNP